MSQPWVAAPRREVWAYGLFVLGRVLLTVALLCATYFLIPTRRPGDGFGVGWLVLQLCVFVAIVGAQVPAIIRSKYPVLRAIEALAVLVPVYLLIFARIYVANSQNDPAGFSKFTEATAPLGAGALLALYTDGLVERRDRDIEDGIEALERLLAEVAPETTDLDHLCDRLLGAMASELQEDDVALLVVRWAPDAA